LRERLAGSLGGQDGGAADESSQKLRRLSSADLWLFGISLEPYRGRKSSCADAVWGAFASV